MVTTKYVYDVEKAGDVIIIQARGFQHGIPTWIIKNGVVQLVQSSYELEAYTEEERQAIQEIEEDLWSNYA